MGFEKSTLNRSFGLILTILIVALIGTLMLQLSVLFLGPSKKACTKDVCLAKFLEGPPAFNDMALGRYIRNNYLVQSYGPSNYTRNVGYDATVDSLLQEIQKHFDNKRGGTFAVMGAGDGEYQDVTLPLEQDLGWTGFLVEPNPELFRRLKQKGRTALLSSNCVSPFPRPIKNFLSHLPVNESESENTKILKYRQTKIHQLASEEATAKVAAQCIPLENLLFAADLNTKLDLLVLDMGGTDMDVLGEVRLDSLPDMEMVVVRAHGEEMEPDIQGFFLDSNMVVSRILGRSKDDKVFVFTKFKGSFDKE